MATTEADVPTTTDATGPKTGMTTTVIADPLTTMQAGLTTTEHSAGATTTLGESSPSGPASTSVGPSAGQATTTIMNEVATTTGQDEVTTQAAVDATTAGGSSEDPSTTENEPGEPEATTTEASSSEETTAPASEEEEEEEEQEQEQGTSTTLAGETTTSTTSTTITTITTTSTIAWGYNLEVTLQMTLEMSDDRPCSEWVVDLQSDGDFLSTLEDSVSETIAPEGGHEMSGTSLACAASSARRLGSSIALEVSFSIAVMTASVGELVKSAVMSVSFQETLSTKVSALDSVASAVVNAVSIEGYRIVIVAHSADETNGLGAGIIAAMVVGAVIAIPLGLLCIHCMLTRWPWSNWKEFRDDASISMTFSKSTPESKNQVMGSDVARPRDHDGSPRHRLQQDGSPTAADGTHNIEWNIDFNDESDNVFGRDDTTLSAI
mmetsp:Transcript_51409/g.109366  ORF Transcript_51409/g.109366 Transcript_51409/m.109366 type:complete len:436 (+) Transcript_51409:387-1694(+)